MFRYKYYQPQPSQPAIRERAEKAKMLWWKLLREGILHIVIV